MKPTFQASFLGAIAVAVLIQSPARAASCIIDPKKFDFISSTPQVFHAGSEEQVRSVYGLLQKRLGNLQDQESATLFYTTGSFSRISTSGCEEEKCSGMDVMLGLQACSAEAPDNPEICYPLAATYEGALYCLLAPGLDNYNARKPFSEFNPYSSVTK
jgi:hypothetical protein